MNKNDELTQLAMLVDLMVKTNSLISVLIEKNIIKNEDLNDKYKLISEQLQSQMKRKNENDGSKE